MLESFHPGWFPRACPTRNELAIDLNQCWPGPAARLTINGPTCAQAVDLFVAEYHYDRQDPLLTEKLASTDQALTLTTTSLNSSIRNGPWQAKPSWGRVVAFVEE